MFMWVWVIIISAVLTALFLVITLARMEAGAKLRFRWLALTFCSLAIMTLLIINKPRDRMEQIDYMLVPPVTENVNEPKDATTKINASIPTGSVSGSAGGEEPQKMGQTGNIQEKANGEFDNYQDPVLREIMELKRQAVENQKAAVSGESSGMTSDKELADSKSHIQVSEQINIIDAGQAKEQQKMDMFSAGQTHQQIDENENTAKARVLASTLNIRDKGSLDGRIVGSLSSGDIIEVIGQSDTGEWINIKLSSGQTGWVMKKYLQYYP